VVDALGNRATQLYYNTGWLRATVDPLGNRTTFSYDVLGHQIVVRDALDRLTTQAWGISGLHVFTIDARGYRTTFTYDAVRRPTAVKDARGKVVTFVYDAAGRLTAQVDQLAQRTSYGYDAAGRQQWRLDAKGQRTTYAYDDASRQTGIAYSDGGLVTFAYDAAANRTRMEDSTGVTTYTFDELRRLKTVTYPASKTLTYSYDAAANRATLVDPDGGTTTYSYDSRNMLSWLLNPFAERTTWLYDALRRVTTMTHANASLAEHDYDAAGRISALRNLKSDRSAISVFTYSYDAIGNRTGVQEASGDLVTWSYDETYQLTREQRSGGNAYDTTYTYDPVGNRLTQVSSGATTTYSYDAANELLTSEDASGVTTYTYDANGNTTGEIRPNSDRVTYTWDIENHLTKAELPSSVVNTITLDGEGKRRSIEDSDGLRKLIWDLENILAETDSSNSTIARYTLAPEVYGALVSQRRSGATSFHHYDALGSTHKLTGADAATIIEYLYRAFGQQTVLSGSSLNRFTWIGRLGYYRQADPDDYWVRARIPHPRTGRWLSRDIMRHAGNRYEYTGGNPATAIDPTGLKECLRCGPDITRALLRALDSIRAKFAALSPWQVFKPCNALWVPGPAFAAWDLEELKTPGSCDTANCPRPKLRGACFNTVQIGGSSCFTAYYVNYVAFGQMMALCRWPELMMRSLLEGYFFFRHPRDFLGLSVAKAWGVAGYHLWGGAAPTAENKPECRVCNEQWGVSGGGFEVHWTGMPGEPWAT